MTITIFANQNGYGLQKDTDVLRSVLTDHSLTVMAPSRDSKGIADVAFHVEHIMPRNFQRAKYNVAIPNIEWLSRASGRYMVRCDLILAKTRYTFDILKEAYPDANVVYTGWTSPDPFTEPPTEKGIVHRGGMSPLKSTNAVIDALGQLKLPAEVSWGRNPTSHFPNVFFTKGRSATVDHRKNIHVYPSQSEGYGHAINEALACGCTVVTTNHAPMNEFGAQYHVPITGTHVHGHAELAHLDTTELRRMILHAWENAPLFDPKAREGYLSRDAAFREAFKQLTWPTPA